MAQKKGWVCLHRSIEDCAIWDTNEPYDRRSAWIDLILMANHEDKRIMFDGEFVTVKRGQKLTSVRKLCARWSWSNDRTLKFLRALENEQMIKRESTKRRTLITLVNYGLYQDVPNTERTLNEHRANTDPSQTTIKQLNNSIYIYSRVVEYLNDKAGTSFKSTTKKTQSCIKARQNEGYGFDDFVRVIDNKCEEWLGTDMQKFLRPETLFGNKFEGYLNQNKKADVKNKRTIVIDGVKHEFVPNVTWLQMERDCPGDCYLTSDNPDGTDCYYVMK